jgi:uncharacterized coiled-coil DUF342 family protein
MKELREKLQSRMDRHASVIDALMAEENEYFEKYGELMPRKAQYNERMGRIYELAQIAEMMGIELTRRY